MSRSTVVLSALGIIFLSLLNGCSSGGGSGSTNPPPPAPIRLVAAVHQDPTLSDVDSPIWDSITALTVPVGRDTAYNANPYFSPVLTAYLQALVADDSLLYVRVKWNDDSRSDRFAPLRASKVASIVEWEVGDTTYYNEDRLSVIFDQGGPGGADCATLCHADNDRSGSGKRFYGEAGDDADIWQWKAHRTGTAGRADDMHLTTIDVSPDPIVDPNNDSLYYENISSRSGSIVVPLFMHPDSSNYSGPVLLESEMPGYTFTPYRGGDHWVDLIANPPVGKVFLPGYIHWDIFGVDGSRWDIRTKAVHNGASWTVVFRRALSTGDADDILLPSAGTDSARIAIAIGNNTGDKHHGTKPFYLVFP